MYCGKCGRKIPDGYEFCVNCGSKGEDSPIHKKRNLKKPIIISSIVVFSIALILLAIWVVTGFLKPQFPYAAMNVNNGSSLSCNSDVIVYIGKLDSSDEKAILLKAEPNGSNKQVLLDDEDISGVFLYNNEVYYKKSTDESIMIGKIGLDGKNNNIIYEVPVKDNSIFNMFVYEDKILYLLNNKICSIDLNGQNQTDIITEKVNSFCIENGTIYFTTDDCIKKHIISSESEEEVLKSKVTSLCPYDGYIYFIKSGSMYRLRTSDNYEEALGGESVSSYILDEDKIYFVETLSDDMIDAYASVLAKSEDETDILWTKLLLVGTGELYSMELDGAKISEVKTDGLLMSSLYNTPQNKYYKLSYFAEGIEELDLKQ